MLAFNAACGATVATLVTLTLPAVGERAPTLYAAQIDGGIVDERRGLVDDVGNRSLDGALDAEVPSAPTPNVPRAIGTPGNSAGTGVIDGDRAVDGAGGSGVERLPP